MDETIERIFEHCSRLIPELLRLKVSSPERQRELLGPVWEHCWTTLESDPAIQRWASDPERLRLRAEQIVDEALASNPPDWESAGRSRSGVFGIYLDSQLHPIEPNEADTPDASLQKVEAHGAHDPHAQETGGRLAAVPVLADALAAAQRGGAPTMARNLRWMALRDEGRSYDSIASQEQAKCKTVRSGVHRARRFTRQIAVQKKRAQNAPHQGRCPSILEPARDAWHDGDLESLRRQLDAAREQWGEHPYFHYLSGLLADDSGDRDSAIALFERILRDDDDPSLRAKVLNCLGYIADDRADLESARGLWLRAVQLDATHTPAHVNILKNACDRRDRLDLLAGIDTIAGLLSARALNAKDKHYLVTRLRDHPDLGWARGFDAWSKGPARWIARQDASDDDALSESGPAPLGRGSKTGSHRARLWSSGIAVALLALGIRAHAPDPAPAEVQPKEARIESPVDLRLLAGPGSGDRGAYSPDARATDAPATHALLFHEATA